MEKLASEESLQKQAEADKKDLIKEWQIKLNDTVKSAREQEQLKAKEILDRAKAEFTDQISEVQRLLADRQQEIEALKEQCFEKEKMITERDQTIAHRDATIEDLNRQIEQLNIIINQNGMDAG